MHSAQKHVPIAQPEKDVFKTFEAFLRFQRPPRTGVNPATNASYVHHLFDVRQRLGIHVDPRNVVVPTGMFAEHGQRQTRWTALRWRASARAYQSFEKACHAELSDHFGHSSF